MRWNSATSDNETDQKTVYFRKLLLVFTHVFFFFTISLLWFSIPAVLLNVPNTTSDSDLTIFSMSPLLVQTQHCSLGMDTLSLGHYGSWEDCFFMVICLSPICQSLYITGLDTLMLIWWMLTGTSRRADVPPVLGSLHRLTVHFRIQFTLSPVGLKALHGLTPAELLTLCSQSMVLTNICFMFPVTIEHCGSAGPQLWNNIPAELILTGLDVN